jgi:hypothetical protein
MHEDENKMVDFREEFSVGENLSLADIKLWYFVVCTAKLNIKEDIKSFRIFSIIDYLNNLAEIKEYMEQRENFVF